MPMSAERLLEYIRDFDIDLARSCVARDTDGQVLGLGMLGVREDKAWITRLGVLPVSRRNGAGDALMDYMLDKADEMHLEESHLEVIKNNEPAHRLFLKKGFSEADEYLVLRRAPHAISGQFTGCVEHLDSCEALRLLETYPYHLTWINAIGSMRNAQDVKGLRVQLPNGGTGWLVYRRQKFFLSHLVLYTEHGDPDEVGTHLFMHLYTCYPRVDTYAENIHEKDPHISAFRVMSFFDNFSRIEMRRPTNNKS